MTIAGFVDRVALAVACRLAAQSRCSPKYIELTQTLISCVVAASEGELLLGSTSTYLRPLLPGHACTQVLIVGNLILRDSLSVVVVLEPIGL